MDDALETLYCQEVIARYRNWLEAYVPVPARLIEECIQGVWDFDELRSESPRLDSQLLTKCWTVGQVTPHTREVPDVLEIGSQLPSFVLLGDTGSGKSVALTRMALQQAIAVQDSPTPSHLPVLVHLNCYPPLSSPEKFLTQYLADQGDVGFPAHQQLSLNLHERLQSGRLLLLFDGLDDLPAKFFSWSLKRWRDFVIRYGDSGRDNRVIVSTSHHELAYGTGLPVVYLGPLTDESKRIILAQYLSVEDTADLWAQLQKPDCVDRLKRMGNPYWLARMAEVYAVRKSVPLKRSQLLNEWIQFAHNKDHPGLGEGVLPPNEAVARDAWLQAYLSARETNQSGGLANEKSAVWRAPASQSSLKAGRLLRHNAFRLLPDLPSSSRREQALLLLEMTSEPVESLRALARVNPLLAAECALEVNTDLVQEAWQEIVQALIDWIDDEKRELRARIVAGNLLGRMGDPRLTETVFVPAGEVVLGAGRNAHVVSVAAFHLCKYPVTRQGFLRFVASDAYHQREWWTRAGWKWCQATGRDGSDVMTEPPNHPVTGVTWYEAVAYGNWLSSQEGVLYHLPSEAEWEKATRGRTDFTFPWGDRADPSRANTCTFDSLYVFGTTPVGIYPKGRGQYGAYDQAGNVWEWCTSQYLPYPYDPHDGREALQSDDARVVRGGSWLQPLERARCSARSAEMPDVTRPDIGFRLLKVAE